MLVCTVLCALRTRDRGCSAHPVFPAPSLLWGERYLQTSGASGRGIANTHLAVIAREGGRPNIPETPMIDPRSRGVLDHPLSRVTTNPWNSPTSTPKTAHFGPNRILNKPVMPRNET